MAGGLSEIILGHAYLRLMSHVNSIVVRKTMLCGRSSDDMDFWLTFIAYEWTEGKKERFLAFLFLTPWHACFVNADFFIKVSTGVCSFAALL